MPDINASLKTAQGEKPAPQHRKAGSTEFEFSDGSNNALHIKTTDLNGNPIDPRKVDVATLESKIDALNAKLDNVGGTVGINNFPATQDVQLTGSNVDLVQTEKNIVLAPGASHYIKSLSNTDKYNDFIVAVRFNANAEFIIKSSFYDSDSSGTLVVEEVISDLRGSAVSQHSAGFQAITPYWNAYVRNEGATDITLVISTVTGGK